MFISDCRSLELIVAASIDVKLPSTAEGTPFSRSMNTALCDLLICWRHRKALIYLLKYAISCRQAHADRRQYAFTSRTSSAHLRNKLPPTLRVPCQSGASSPPSSSPSLRSDSGPLVDISDGVFHSHLKTFLFSKSFPP